MMRSIFRALKSTLIAVLALAVFFLLLFPPRSTHDLQETLVWLVIAAPFLAIPLFLSILIFNAIFRPRTLEETPLKAPGATTLFRSALVGAILIGIPALFIPRIIPPVWGAFVLAGAIVGLTVGYFRR